MAGTRYPQVYVYEAGGKTLFRCHWQDANGRQRGKRGFASALAANRHRESQVALAKAGIAGVAPKPKQSFADLFDEYLAARKPYVSQGTIEGYETIGRRRLKPYFTGPASKITKHDVRAFMTTMAELVEDEQIAPKTVNNILIVLVACFSWAVEDERLVKNPALGIERLPVDDKEPDYLRLKEIGRYLDACTPTYRPLAELLIGSGVRISEALALRWRDVDFAGMRVIVYRQAVTGGGSKPTKGRNFHSVEVEAGLLRTLKALQARQAEHVQDIDSALVFTMPTRVNKTDLGRWVGGGAMDRNTVSRDWHKDALQEAGLRDMPLHSLRHTAAASWLGLHRSLYYVQRQLGHRSPSTTDDTYGHLELHGAPPVATTVEAAVEAARVH